MSIIRAYKRDDDGVLLFREAWYEEDIEQFVLNWGTVGFQSTTKETDDVAPPAAEELFAAFSAQCLQDGYAEVPVEDQHWVIAQYALKTETGTDRDRYLETKAKAAITEHFAWRGIGIVDRSEFAARKLNIYCLVPDVAKAVTGLKTCLRDPNLDFTKLSIGAAPYGDLAAVRQKYPLPAKGTFSLD
jgi:hypothetical protein